MSVRSQIHAAASQYRQILEILSETSHAKPALDEQIVWIAELENEIRDSDLRVKEYNRARESNLKKHEKYRDSRVRRLLYKATGNREKFAEKVSKGEMEYFDVLQKAHEEDRRNATLKYSLVEAQTAKEELESVVQSRNRAQRELGDMYRRIFTGPTEEFPEEDAYEKRCDDALAAYWDCRRRFEGETMALNAVRNASGWLRVARQHMESARSYLCADGPGKGSFLNHMGRSELDQADAMVTEARSAMATAQRASRFVLKLPGINNGNMLRNVLFGHLFLDTQFREEIKRACREVDRSYAASKGEVVRCKERRAALQSDLAEREADLHRARRELLTIRAAIFARVVSSSSQVRGRRMGEMGSRA